jgi:SAM-dependent methyltransferase
MAAFLYAVHGGEPRTMREDFCGSGGVCRAWAAMTPPEGSRGTLRAIGVDLDAEPLRRLKGVRNVKAVRADVIECDLEADIISATNFPVGYWYTRRDLVRYLRLVRRRLTRGGIFVCDTYGGATAFTIGTLVRDLRSKDGLRIRYTWEQREADPLTSRVTDAIHFRVDRDGEIVYQEHDAFVYHWRLWSVPELREAMKEAGFKRTEVYSELADAVDQTGRLYVRPVADPRELDDTFIVCIAARV